MKELNINAAEIKAVYFYVKKENDKIKFFDLTFFDENLDFQFGGEIVLNNGAKKIGLIKIEQGKFKSIKECDYKYACENAMNFNEALRCGK